MLIYIYIYIHSLIAFGLKFEYMPIGFLFPNYVTFSSQIFAIQLLSHLCTQYALPKSLTVARLAISVMGTLLTRKQTFVVLYLFWLLLFYGVIATFYIATGIPLTCCFLLYLVLTRAKRFAFFMPTLPCLVSICWAFPPLYDDVASLLVQLGQVCAADAAAKAQDIDPFIASKFTLYFQCFVKQSEHKIDSCDFRQNWLFVLR